MTMRAFMNLVEGALVHEKYSRDNVSLKKYLDRGEFDPYAQWHWVCDWLSKNLHEYVGPEDLDGPLASLDDLEEEDPAIFFDLPPQVQKACASDVIDYVLQHDPAEAPSHAHMMTNGKRLLPRSTWLIHFSDEAEAIAHNGFQYGVDQMDKLGLTRWLGDIDKSGQGYNFAFEAGGRDARYAASKGKYGRHAVMFQNSGVSVSHHGDEEDQVIFHGSDVDPRTIVLLVQREGDWYVINRRAGRGERDYLMKGDFETCERWVIKHAQQHRGTATRR